MQLYRMWFFIIVLTIIHDNVTSVYLDIDENLVLKICNMKFCGATKTNCNLEYCIEQMASENKFGDCPKPNNSDARVNCYDDCDGQDYRCSGAMKCCWSNSCNRSCLMPENVSRISSFTLPPIPTNVSVISIEHTDRRKAKISWLMRTPHNRCEEQFKTDYVVEARAHVGSSFSKHKLGQWFVISTKHLTLEPLHSHNTKISCEVTLQIGRFYEFHILALNGNGTRGCSESTLFQLNEKPKHVSPPVNFTLASTPKLTANNSVYARLKWQEPNTDYPIEKYELSYSLYINEGNGSLVMERIRIPVIQNSFQLNGLSPDSIYYVQICGISSFGKKRLKSERASIYLNTTIAS